MRFLKMGATLPLSIKIPLSGLGLVPSDAKLTAGPTWASSDVLVATIAASSDGTSAVLTPIGPGKVTVTVAATANLGGSKVIYGEFDVEVVADYQIEIGISG